MKIIPFRRRTDRALEIALAIFQALRPGVDAPTAVLESYPDLNSDELFEAFSQAHHVLNNPSTTATRQSQGRRRWGRGVTMFFPHPELEKLAKLCGLFSSHHDGERASAAAKADEIVRSLGLTWRDIVLNKTAPAPAGNSIEAQIAEILAHISALNAWEKKFIRSLTARFFSRPSSEPRSIKFIARCAPTTREVPDDRHRQHHRRGTRP